MQRTLLLSLALLCCASTSLTAQVKSLKAAKARYDECMAREPLVMKYRGWEALARSGHREALKILITDYARAEEPEEQVRSLLVNECTKHIDYDENAALFDSWRARFRKAQHVWLWYQVLRLGHDDKADAERLELVRNERDPYLRTAALITYLEAKPRQIESITMELLSGKQPRREFERGLILEALILGFHRRAKADLGDEDYNEALKKMIMQLDEKKVPERTKRMMVRFLGKIFNSGRRSINADPWILQLKAGRNKEVKRDNYSPTFFDIRASGDRIAYVIDLSDSMTRPVSRKFLESKRTTGRSRREKDKKTDPFADDYDIPWHKINNRFDLAREHLKASLYGLAEDKRFTVIGFGDKAEFFKGTNGMVPATRRNISRVVRALDAMKPGSPTATRPTGTIWGKTNLYGALRYAYQVKHSGKVDSYENIAPQSFMEGADTIFLLSDGNPSWDDWDLVAENYNEDRIGDPESGIQTGGGDRMHYGGPYRSWERILDDVKRLNLMRNLEIHCVGIGEVQMPFLERLSAIGHGQTRKYGS